MNCPVCENERLVMADRQGVEIDYCPRCRGVWLDRGELDKILERSLAESTPSRPTAAPTPPPRYQPIGYPKPDSGDLYYGDPRYHKGYRKKSLLKEIFDF